MKALFQRALTFIAPCCMVQMLIAMAPSLTQAAQISPSTRYPIRLDVASATLGVRVFDQEVMFFGKKPGYVLDFQHSTFDDQGNPLTGLLSFDGYYGKFSFRSGRLYYEPGPGYKGFDQGIYRYTNAFGQFSEASVILRSSDHPPSLLVRRPIDRSSVISLRQGLAAQLWLDYTWGLRFSERVDAYLESFKLGPVTRKPNDPVGMLRFAVPPKTPPGPGTVTFRAPSTGASLGTLAVKVIAKDAPQLTVGLNPLDNFLGSYVGGKPKTRVNFFADRASGLPLSNIEIFLGANRGFIRYDEFGATTAIEFKGNVVNFIDGTILPRGQTVPVSIDLPPPPSHFRFASARSAQVSASSASASSANPEIMIQVHRTDGSPVDSAKVVLTGTDRSGNSAGSIEAISQGGGLYRAALNQRFAHSYSGYGACEAAGAATAIAAEGADEFGDALGQTVTPNPLLTTILQGAGKLVKGLGFLTKSGVEVDQYVQDACDNTVAAVDRVFSDVDVTAYVTSAPGLTAPVRSDTQRLSRGAALPSFAIALNIPSDYFGLLSVESFTLPACSTTADVNISGVVNVQVLGKHATVSVGWTVSSNLGAFNEEDGGLLTVTNGRIQGKLNRKGRSNTYAVVDLTLNTANASLTGSVTLLTHIVTQEGNTVCFEGDRTTTHSLQ